MNALFDQNQLFAGVEPGICQKIAEGLDIENFANDQVIFSEGDLGDSLYLVGKGAVRISKLGRGGRQETLKVFESGDFFGEMTLIDQKPRSAQATASGEVVLGRMNGAGLNRAIGLAPDAITFNFIHTVVDRLRSSNTHFIDQMMLNERMSVVGTMASSIIHDFKNPMSAILCACDFLKMKGETPLIVSMTDIIQKSVDRMMNMTQELLDFSRGNTSLTLEKGGLELLLQALNEQAFDVAKAAGIEVLIDLQFQGEMEADFSRLERMLLNILKNARESMPKGGRLTFVVSRDGDHVCFLIEDTGCGIPPEILSRIYEPFVTHGKSGGTGLGMAITKSVIDSHHGRIDVQSTPGEGTTFRIALPISQPRTR